MILGGRGSATWRPASGAMRLEGFNFHQDGGSCLAIALLLLRGLGTLMEPTCTSTLSCRLSMSRPAAFLVALTIQCWKSK